MEKGTLDLGAPERHEQCDHNQRSATLDEWETKLNKRSANLDEWETKLNERSANLDEWETKLNERTAKLDERETKFRERETKVIQREAQARKAMQGLLHAQERLELANLRLLNAEMSLKSDLLDEHTKHEWYDSCDDEANDMANLVSRVCCRMESRIAAGMERDVDHLRSVFMELYKDEPLHLLYSDALIDIAMVLVRAHFEAIAVANEVRDLEPTPSSPAT